MSPCDYSDEPDPFDGTYLLQWRYFADAPEGKKWQAFFVYDGQRYAAIPKANSTLPSKPDAFMLVSILRRDVSKQRKSGIVEVEVELDGKNSLDELFPRLMFYLGQHPKNDTLQWKATIHAGMTVKVIMDKDAVVMPIEDNGEYEWVPKAVLHRSPFGKFILVSAMLKMTAEERASRVRELEERQAREKEQEKVREEKSRVEAKAVRLEWEHYLADHQETLETNRRLGVDQIMPRQSKPRAGGGCGSRMSRCRSL